jgi:hypothetical protein
MPFVTGGYANAGFDFNARAPNAGAAGATTLIETAHVRAGGWYIGGGVEWAVSPGWTAGLEYRHYEFGSENTAAYNPANELRWKPHGSLTRRLIASRLASAGAGAVRTRRRSSKTSQKTSPREGRSGELRPSRIPVGREGAEEFDPGNGIGAETLLVRRKHRRGPPQLLAGRTIWYG